MTERPTQPAEPTGIPWLLVAMSSAVVAVVTVECLMLATETWAALVLAMAAVVVGALAVIAAILRTIDGAPLAPPRAPEPAVREPAERVALPRIAAPQRPTHA